MISRSRDPFNVAIKSAPLVARYGFSPASLKPFVICLSSSSRSVIITTRASGRCSLIHCASQTIVSDLPEPCECQMMPDSLRMIRGFAASSAKNCAGRITFFTPPSNTTPSWIKASNRSLSSICANRRSTSGFISDFPHLGAAHGLPHGSFHFNQYFSGVRVVAYFSPSDSLPAIKSCAAAKNAGISPACWLR